MNDLLFDDLSLDVLSLIPTYFDSIYDVLSFSLVCKKWYDAFTLCSKITAPVLILIKNDTDVNTFSKIRLNRWNLTTIKVRNKVTGERWERENTFSICIKHIAEQIGKSQSITKVDLSGCKYVTDIVVYHIANCLELRNVNFSGCDITDDAVRLIAYNPLFNFSIRGKNSKIESVDFSRCKDITRNAVQFLAKCPNLQHVNFSGCDLTNFSLKSISECLNIKSVDFSGYSYSSQITDTGVKYLENCHNLEYVNFCGTYITDEAVKSIVKCPKLRSVNFSRCSSLTSDACRILTECSNLQDVNFGYCTYLTDDAVRYIINCTKRFTNLRSIKFSQCQLLTNDAFTSLGKCIGLRHVNIAGCELLTDETVRFIAQCPNLEEVIFADCEQFTDVAVEYIAKCLNIRYINFNGCYLLTDKAIDILKDCPKLQRCTFHRCGLKEDRIERNLTDNKRKIEYWSL